LHAHVDVYKYAYSALVVKFVLLLNTKLLSSCVMSDGISNVQKVESRLYVVFGPIIYWN